MVDGSAEPGRAYRTAVCGFALALVAAVWSPVFRNPPADSFPLSDYPMFSHGRPNAALTLTHALGVSANGETVPLSPTVAAGTSEVLQSMVTIGRSVGEGRSAVFCQEVAARVTEHDDLASVVEVWLATSRFDCVQYFEQGAAPLDRTVHARCPVNR